MESDVTMKYKKKIRLLVTNKCSRNCKYCHNEGMPKWPIQNLNPVLLERFLSGFKKYTNKIVLSGGEPFEYEYLQELVELLSSYGFDLSLITANVNFEKLDTIAYGLKNLHYSIHDINRLDADIDVIRLINNKYPNIRISLNVPLVRIDSIKDNWDLLYGLALEIGANIQFIRIFSLRNNDNAVWSERWRELIDYIKPFAQFLEATEREARYITRELLKIELLDIPCQASGTEFCDGACLNNSDITIDPEMKVSICRWADASAPLYLNDTQIALENAIKQAAINSCQNCPYGKISNYMLSDDLDYYLNAPHYSWPRLNDRLESIYSKTYINDISYYGMSGAILRLENEFAKYTDVKYSLAVASGTVAVYLACLSLNLSHEDEVLIPVATFPTLVAALLSAGVKVILCDIDPLTGNISLESLQDHISLNVKAVLVTHMWGLPVDMEAIQNICNPLNIFIIEDCSHAYGAEVCGKKVGSYGDISCFSMQANKVVYAGEGGMLVTSSRMFYERAVVLSSSVERIFDCVKDKEYLKYWGTGLGLKLKMNPLGAPLALLSLSNVEEVNRQRRVRVSIIEKSVSNSGIFAIIEPNIKHCQRVYYTYKLALKEQYIGQRDSILQMLIHYGLEANKTSFIPVYQHELCSHKDVVNADEEFPGAEKYYHRIISLPAFVYEPIALSEYYADVISTVSNRISCTNMI